MADQVTPIVLDDRDKATLEMVLGRFQRADDDRARRVEQWEEYYKLYRSYIDDEDWNDDGANLFIPECFTNVETIVPRLIEAMFEPNPAVTALPRGPGDVNGARPIELLLDYQFDRAKIQDKFEDTCKEALVYGTGVGKVRWRYEAQQRPTWVPRVIPVLGIAVGRRQVMQVVVAYDDPDYIPVDLMDFWLDPDATDLEDARYVIHRSWVDLDQLRREAQRGVYRNIDQVQLSMTQTQDRPHRERLSLVGLGTTANRDQWARSIELLEYWEDGRVVTVADRAVVIRDEPNPYWHGRKPFILIRDVKVPHEPYGIGEVEVIRYLQAELNTMRCQRLDSVSLIINAMYSILRGAEIDPDQLRSRPGGFVEVNSHEDIKPLQQPTIHPSAWTEEQLILQNIQRALGTYDYSRGQQPERKTTATEVVSLQEVAEIRFRHKIRRFGREGLCAIAGFFHALDQQYMTAPRLLRIVEDEGYNWQPVRPEEIRGEYDFELAAAGIEPLANKQLQRQNMLALFNVVKGHPGVHEYEFLKRIFELHDVKGVEKYLDRQVFEALRQLQLAQIMPPALPAQGAVPAAPGSVPPAPASPTVGGGPVA